MGFDLTSSVPGREELHAQKKCTICGEVKGVSHFRRRGRTKDGKQLREGRCSPCIKRHGRWYRHSLSIDRAHYVKAKGIAAAHGLSLAATIEMLIDEWGAA